MTAKMDKFMEVIDFFKFKM